MSRSKPSNGGHVHVTSTCTCCTCGYRWIQGTDGSHRCAAVLNKDSQHVEARKFTVDEIAHAFGVSPHLIAIEQKSTLPVDGYDIGAL